MGKTASEIRMGRADAMGPSYKTLSVITAGDLELRPADSYFYSESRIPCYEFLIFVGGEEAGTYYGLIEGDLEKVRESGNVGVEINEPFRGRDLPAKATRAMIPFFREQGLDTILITTDKGNLAIHKACEHLSASYLDTIDSQPPGKQIDRFLLKIKS